MPTVAVDRKVPDFQLPAAGGGQPPATGELTWRLKDAAGGALVVYFYPKDMTAGCTLEAQGFRDLYPKFKRAGVQVVGISRDSLASHEKFCQKESLPFPLLSDAQEKVCGLFDVIREKTLYGRKYLGIERSTFLVDAAGILRREWRKVKVDGHVEEVLEAAKCV